MALDQTKPSQGDALGFVEVFGLTAAIEAADAMGKAARVRVKSVCNADAGILSVVCEGDLAACKAAVDAGKAAAERLGGLLSSNLIARPYSDTDVLVSEHVGSMFKPKKAAPPKQAKAKK
ncbi:MAG: BMC domain-containing protein [Desulfovibrio sp.]|nr:BMC domain-containing protein [Desulfovibrio sp.]MBI4957888.1 BMC domain-containing protein [Desulfovibrio sp.]